MSAAPANEAELNAAAWECADSSVDRDKAENAARLANQAYIRAVINHQPDDQVAELRAKHNTAQEAKAAQQLRHNTATAHWNRIRPAKTEASP